MTTWCIHERDGEFARSYGDACVETVEATTKEEAERLAKRGNATGPWAVQVGSSHVPPPEVLLGEEWCS